MFVLLFVCLTFDSRNIALIVRERMVQPKLYRLYRSNSADCSFPRCTGLSPSPRKSASPPSNVILVMKIYLVLQGAAKKVIPCRIFQNFQQPLRIFWRNSAIIFSVHTDISAKYCLIILKYDKVVWFQTRQPPSFDVVKNIKQTRTHNKLYK